MVVTNSTSLPTVDELTVPELNVSFPLLQAAAFTMGKYCEYHNNEFMLCRDETQDVRKCIDEGKAVTACALDFFRKIKKNCYNEFTQYYNCIDKSSGVGAFEYCRQTQAVYDKCVLDKLNIERPGYGYFCEVKIHDSTRPKPQPEKRIIYEDVTPGLPKDAPLPEARFNSRFQWSK
ncbi:NADH dehydrogenase [ubiquinone] 1 alpha subcomplex subunit 8 [Venturia canescens]|uniref:NADH dehydrogenase [ubiquinone] 1 alpha subcomplex subunit 8 n=1 Tax=Venturia canescens TaxID=32260 RepID=UPI001C9D3030|nr:NADH dehydrogenase [ubiquinone] 1 alpha subcomplex subunit 8 [Venturia canescens]